VFYIVITAADSDCDDDVDVCRWTRSEPVAAAAATPGLYIIADSVTHSDSSYSVCHVIVTVLSSFGGDILTRVFMTSV